MLAVDVLTATVELAYFLYVSPNGMLDSLFSAMDATAPPNGEKRKPATTMTLTFVSWLFFDTYSVTRTLFRREIETDREKVPPVISSS